MEKRSLMGYLFCIFLAVSSYFGLMKGNSIAYAITMVEVWLAIFISAILLLMPEKTVAEVFHKGPSIPRSLDISVDTAVVLMLLINDLWITGALYSAQILIIHWAFSIGTKHNGAKSETVDLAKKE